MAATAKNYLTTEIQQGPGDVWTIATAPDDTAQRLTLAADGTPASGSHTATHLGPIQGAVTTVAKPKIAPIAADQADAPVDGYVTETEMSIEAEFMASTASKLQRIGSVGTYATSAGYNQLTFGGGMSVASACLAAISALRSGVANTYMQALLYKAVQTGPLSFTLGRAKPMTYKGKWTGLADLTRTAGRQIGIVARNLTAVVGGAATAKDFTISQIQQGPCDLWIVGTPPVDATPRLTLTSLTPDATAHPSSINLGMTETAVTVTVTPKLEAIRCDQADAAVDYVCTGLTVKLETELSQSGATILQSALGFGSAAYSKDAGGTPAWDQVSVGGLTAPSEFCVAAIAPKRSDTTKAWVALLFKVLSEGGVTVMFSRAKKNTVKVSFTGLADLSRTAGQQTANIYETT